MPTKFRLPEFVPIVKTKVINLGRKVSGNGATPLSLLQEGGPSIDPSSVSTELSENSENPPQSSGEVLSEGPDEKSSEVTFKGGHHEELKKGDFGFNMGLSGLEKFARDQAHFHAQAGLPRMQAEAPEELPVEAILRARAAELFVDWKTRSVRRVQDALQAAVLEAGNGVVALRHAIDQAKLSQYRAGKIERELRRAKSLSEGKDRTLAYGARLGPKGYRALVGILTVIEWVANVAVFRGLLPPDKGTEQALLQMFADTEDSVWFGGVQRMIGKAFIFPEAALLALGTIVILMYLTHVCGESYRQLTAFRKEDDPAIAHGLVSRERQAKNAFRWSLAGILAILIFLTGSRALLSHTASARLQRQDQKITELEAERQSVKAKAPDDTKALSEVNRNVAEAKAARQVLRDNADFGEAISAMNWIIVALNLGLVTVATVAAYQASEGRLLETRLSDPAVSALEAEMDEALSEIMALRHKARTLDLEIQANVAHARYLSTATPAQDWEAKIERLNSVVALFRTENAAIRGIDVQNIVAFAEKRNIELSAPDIHQPLVLPPEFHECESEFSRLRGQLDFLRTDLLTEATGEEIA